MTVRPWELVHRGQVRAAGMILEPARIGEDAARRRVLGIWVEGDRLHALGARWLLTFGSPRPIGPDGPGLPLVARQDALIASPLRDDEWAARPPGRVLEVRGGVLVGQDPGAELDPSAWVAVPAAVASVGSLAPPARPPVAGIEPVSVDRRAFGVAEEAASAASLKALLLGTPGAADDLPAPPPELPGWASRALSWLGGTSAKAPTGPGPGASGGGAFPGLGAFLERMLARGMQGLGMGAALEQRQAMALEELLERFGGDLEEALKHAIPLGGASGSGLSGSHPALRLPPPRSSLAPSLGVGGGGAGPSFGASSSMYEALQAAYRAAAARLEAEGEIEKAAFVLSDLLKDLDAAVELLDRHERWALAARLWEARGTGAAERAIRWYFLAGEVPRAIRLAHVTQRFAAAVELLASDPGRQRGLRKLWAAHLIAAGRPAAACDAVWPDAELRVGAIPWLKEVAADRGGAGATALLRWAAVDPAGAEPAFAERLADPRGQGARAALARSLASAGGPAGWGRPLARALLCDGEAGPVFQQLARSPDLADLLIDAPPEGPSATGRIVDQRLEAPAGTGPIVDAVVTVGGVLCALGPEGLALLDGEGRVIWRDPSPASALVVDPDGVVVLALDRLAGAVRVARVDVGARAVRPWARLDLLAWAPTCLAGRWLVADRERELLLDLTSPNASWLWQGPVRGDVGVRGLDASAERMCVARTNPDELWWYDEAMVYRRRAPFESGDPLVLRGSDALTLTRGAGPVWTQGGAARVLEAGVYDGFARELALTDAHAVVARELAAPRNGPPVGVRVELWDAGGRVVGRIDVADASRVRMRAWDARLLLFDDLGRLWELDADTLRVLRHGRV